MPVCFWATQTVAAASELRDGGNVGSPSYFKAYTLPATAAVTVQLAYCSYVERVVRQHRVVVSGANATAIAQQTPMDDLLALVNANAKAVDTNAKAIAAGNSGSMASIVDLYGGIVGSSGAGI